jgi:hypothetical protein
MDLEEQKEAHAALWCSTLEMFCHQVLYVRRLYPKESFCTTRFLGVQCYANRHPQVVGYITETVKMAATSLLEGTSSEMAIIIFDQITQCRHEKYTLSFAKTPLPTTTSSSSLHERERERDARDFILSVLTLEGVSAPNWDSSVTFRIELFLPKEMISATSQLNQDLSDGKWFCHDRRSTSRADECRRPVFHMSTSTGKFYFQIDLEDETDPTPFSA